MIAQTKKQALQHLTYDPQETARPQRFKLCIGYLGKEYFGFQDQKTLPTIQGTLNQTLKLIGLQHFSTKGAARTDTGVNAHQQIVKITCKDCIDIESLEKGLKLHLPPDIWFLSLDYCAGDFDPSGDVISKTYAYFFVITNGQNRKCQSNIDQKYVEIFHLFDIDKCRSCLELLQGEHDFRHFTAAGSSVKSTRRMLNRVQLSSPRPQHYVLTFEAKGFLKQMIRNIVSAIWMVSSNKLTIDDFTQLLQAKGEKRQRWRPAPAQGLWLESISYKNSN